MVKFLPVSKKELKKIGWSKLDIIIITGDAYIDHPGFGAAIIGRFLESNGFKVGIISQPDWKSDQDFLELGKPELFFGITSGNMDSMVNHYTAQKKIRTNDAYSPEGKPGLRPNRATIIYSQKIRSLFKNAPIIIGGIEASLRRIPHYDFWSDKVRNSILFDSKADILVYGMAEKPILEIARELQSGTQINELKNIKGTVVSSKKVTEKDHILLPEFSKNFTKEDFYEMHQTFYENYFKEVIYQKFSHRYLKHNLPSEPLSTAEIDNIYNLPYARLPHPIYKNKKITAFEQIKNSITSHRGCFGGCYFCSLSIHQGRAIQSRSIGSIINDIKNISQKDYFKGTISDIGGPTANMYGMFCKKNLEKSCSLDSCIYPEICTNLQFSHEDQKILLKKCREIKSVKNLFITSGIRHDLALTDKEYIKEISENHTGGLLKLAPEHKSEKVLKCMNKPGFYKYEEFVKIFSEYSRKCGKKQFIIPYIIVGHPGSDLTDSIELALYLKKHNIKLKQIQEFTPTPMTISTMMYFTGRNTSGEKICIPKGREIRLRKALVQWFEPGNKKLIIEVLKKANRKDLINYFLL